MTNYQMTEESKVPSLFLIPPDSAGNPRIYLAGNSLGLQPVSIREAVEQELEDWGRLAVDAHFDGRTPWYNYHESVGAVGGGAAA